MSGGQVKQTEIILGPLRRSDLNSKLSCRAINHPNANPLEATVQIDMNCKYLSPPYSHYLYGTHSVPANVLLRPSPLGSLGVPWTTPGGDRCGGTRDGSGRSVGHPPTEAAAVAEDRRIDRWTSTRRTIWWWWWWSRWWWSQRIYFCCLRGFPVPLAGEIRCCGWMDGYNMAPLGDWRDGQQQQQRQQSHVQYAASIQFTSSDCPIHRYNQAGWGWGGFIFPISPGSYICMYIYIASSSATTEVDRFK